MNNQANQTRVPFAVLPNIRHVSFNNNQENIVARNQENTVARPRNQSGSNRAPLQVLSNNQLNIQLNSSTTNVQRTRL